MPIPEMAGSMGRGTAKCSSSLLDQEKICTSHIAEGSYQVEKWKQQQDVVQDIQITVFSVHTKEQTGHMPKETENFAIKFPKWILTCQNARNQIKSEVF